jgi:hypothetical protein
MPKESYTAESYPNRYIRRAATCGVACAAVHIDGDYKLAPLYFVSNDDNPVPHSISEARDFLDSLTFSDWRKQLIDYGYGIQVTTKGDAYLIAVLAANDNESELQTTTCAGELWTLGKGAQNPDPESDVIAIFKSLNVEPESDPQIPAAPNLKQE